MHEHTPGPWKVTGCAVTARVGPSERVVCEVSTSAPSRGEMYRIDEHLPEYLANAQVLAASPAMLAVLRRADAYLDAALHGRRPPENAIALARDIRAAIAEAAGQEPGT